MQEDPLEKPTWVRQSFLELVSQGLVLSRPIVFYRK
jgi:hypothetical protein